MCPAVSASLHVQLSCCKAAQTNPKKTVYDVHRVVEGVVQVVRSALSASLPVELQARLAGTPNPTSGQVRNLHTRLVVSLVSCTSLV